MSKKIKYIKVKNDSTMVLLLHHLVMNNTNSPLISVAIHRLCQKFAKDLEQIPLSEELQ